jgi:hypothetical protein
VTHLKGTFDSSLSSHSFDFHCRSPTKSHILRVRSDDKDTSLFSSSTTTTTLKEHSSTGSPSSPLGPITIRRGSNSASTLPENTETIKPSRHTRNTSLSEKLASLRKAGYGSLPKKNGTKGTFGYAKGIVEGGGEGLEYCVRVFEEKYWTNMRGMKEDIGAFCKLRKEEFRRRRQLSRLEEKELDWVRERFGGERVHRWAFSALKEMALEYDDGDRPVGQPGLAELYARLEAEAFVQQVAGDQAKVGADAALEADWVVGCAVESALSACANVDIEASRMRVKGRLATMRQIAVEELADVDAARGAELLHVCADLEVRLAGYREDSEQVSTTKYYAGILERMDS